MESTPTSDLRVLHVITGMQRGGAEKVASQLALARPDRAGIAWLKGRNDWEESFTHSSVDLSPLKLRALHDLPRAVNQLTRLIRTFRPDVVHTHLLHAHLAGRWAARRTGDIAVVSTEHNMRLDRRGPQRCLQTIEVRTSRRCGAIAAISEAVRSRCIATGFSAGSLTVVYNGVALPPYVPPFPVRARPLVVMVGRLLAVKGPDLFLRAMEMLPEADGLILGDGDMRGMVARMVEELSGRVRWQAEGDVLEAMTQADVVVVPSRHEGLGLVALEAMALGRPVVVASVDGLPEVVEDGESGLLVPAEDPSAISEAVRRLLSNRALRCEMGRAGRQRVEDCFTLSRMIGRYEQIYRDTHSKA